MPVPLFLQARNAEMLADMHDFCSRYYDADARLGT